MSEDTGDWIPDSPGEDPEVPDVERSIEGGGVDADDPWQDVAENLGDDGSAADIVAVEPPD